MSCAPEATNGRGTGAKDDGENDDAVDNDNVVDDDDDEYLITCHICDKQYYIHQNLAKDIVLMHEVGTGIVKADGCDECQE